MSNQPTARGGATFASGGARPVTSRVLLVVGADHFGTYPLGRTGTVDIGRDAA